MKLALPTPRVVLASVVAGVVAFFVPRGGFVSQGPLTDAESAGGTGDAGPAAGGALAEGMEATGAGSAAELFTAAGAEEDIFRRAEKTFMAIEKLTAADFAGFVARREVPEFSFSSSTQYDKAVLRAFVERWLAVEPAGAVSSLLTLCTPLPDGTAFRFGEELARVFAEVRPGAFLAGGLVMPEGSGLDADELRGVAMTALARTQPDAARRYVAGAPKEERDRLQRALVRGLTVSDPVAAAREAAADNSYGREIFGPAIRTAARTGLGVLREVLAVDPAFSFDPKEIPLLCARYPALAADLNFPENFAALGDEDLDAFFERLPREELQRRLAASEQLPGPVREVLTAAMARAWAAREPREAIDWAMAQPKSGRRASATLSAVYASWQEADPAAASAWWDGLPESPLKIGLGQDAAVDAAENGDLEQALKMYSPDSEKSNARTGAFLAHRLAAEDPAGAVQWMAAFPMTGSSTDQLTVSFAAQMPPALQTWFARNAEGAAEWVEGLPEGLWRDQAAMSLAQATTAEDPAAAAEWIGAIGNAEERLAATAEAFERLSRANPAQAREWLRTVPGMPAAEQEKLLHPWGAKTAKGSGK